MSDTRQPKEGTEDEHEHAVLTEIPEELQSVFDLFSKRFEPVGIGYAGALRKTTAEIYDDMYAHCPIEGFAKLNVFSFMKANKFLFDLGGDGQYYWLMKKRDVRDA